jgi:hypothetical protein
MTDTALIVSPVAPGREEGLRRRSIPPQRTTPIGCRPLREEVNGLITPGKNPWFEHAEAELFLARREGKVVGRISAQIDALVLEHMGAGTGQWGLFEAADAETARALLAAAEAWLKAKGMKRALGPFSLSIWDEPGLLVAGFDHPPMVMMGHNQAAYQGWIEGAGYYGVKDLYTYEVDVSRGLPPVVQRIVESGARNPRIRLRKVDRSKFDEEAALILSILNDAWGDNWGFIPLTDSEIAFAGKKLKPIVFPDLVKVAELDGEAVAFMIVLPNLNLVLKQLGGRLFPFGWARLLTWLRRRHFPEVRVPLMGGGPSPPLQSVASQLAFMLIETIRAESAGKYGIGRSELGWVLDDNEGMKSIAAAIHSKVNRVYRVYERAI